MKAHLIPYVSYLELASQGKSRDTFLIPRHDDLLLIVATDRVSTNEVVHQSLVPGKGQILNAMTIFWSLQKWMRGVPTHLVAYGKKIYEFLPQGKNYQYPDDLHLRATVVKKLNIIPYEFIYRAYLTGSLWDKFYSKGIPNHYGVNLPPSMKKMSAFDPSIFTPTEKSEIDDPVNSESIIEKFPYAVQMAWYVYDRARNYANTKGIEIIDAKFEVGVDINGDHYLTDEWLNGDSSRLVLTKDIVEGENPPWLDKQVFRDEAKRLWKKEGKKIPLKFSTEINQKGIAAYQRAFEKLTDKSLKNFQDTYFV